MGRNEEIHESEFFKHITGQRSLVSQKQEKSKSFQSIHGSVISRHRIWTFLDHKLLWDEAGEKMTKFLD